MAVDETEPDLIGMSQAANIVGVSRISILKWTKKGLLSYVQTPYGRLLYRKEVEAVAKNRAENGRAQK